jgi:hypothetical protein
MSFHFDLSASSYSSTDEDQYLHATNEGREEDEEEETYQEKCDEEEKKELLLQQQQKYVAPTQSDTWFSVRSKLNHGNDGSNSIISSGSDEYDEELDWEEGMEDEEEEELKQKELSLITTREVTVNMLETNDDVKPDSNNKKRPIRRSHHKLTNLPMETTQLVRNIHQTHLLTLTARAIHSLKQILKLRQCNLVVHVAASLIPLKFHTEQKQHEPHYTVPTYQQLQSFTQWYFTWINTLRERIENNRRRNLSMGAPSSSSINGHRKDNSFSTSPSNYHYYDDCNLCSTINTSTSTSLLHKRMCTILYHLASSYHDDDPTNSTTFVTITPKEKLYLYIFLCHSCLHWRGVRFVNSFSPVELELTCTHPLFKVDDETKPNKRNKYDYLQQLYTSSVATVKPQSLSSLSYQSSGETCSSDRRYYTRNKNRKQKAAIIDLTHEGSNSEEFKKPAIKNNNNNIDSLVVTIGRMLTYFLDSNKTEVPLTNSIMRAHTNTGRDTMLYCGESAGGDQFAWAEVLCHEDENVNNLRWIHVDNQYELFDQPQMVEHILTALVKKKTKNESNDLQGTTVAKNGMSRTATRSQRNLVGIERSTSNSRKPPSRRKTTRKSSTENNSSVLLQHQHQGKKAFVGGIANDNNNNNRKGKQLVSYVLAVEYRVSKKLLSQQRRKSSSTEMLVPGIHITDVTPRYASAWSKTLKLRGATNRDLVAAACSNNAMPSSSSSTCHTILWWEGIVQKVNQAFQHKHPIQPTKEITTSSSKLSVQPLADCGDEIIFVDELQEEKVTKDHISGHGATSNSKNSKTAEGAEEDDLLVQVESAKEQIEFKAASLREAIPTSKSAFKNHPLYVIPSVLKEFEVLTPDSKNRICGMFKGELVYKRCDVSPAYSEKKWLYEQRKVRERELNNPAKVVTPKRRNNKPKAFKALATYGFKSDSTDVQQYIAENSRNENNTCYDDAGKVRLYGIWQTDAWRPKRVGPNDEIPRNEYGNVEKAMINPGLEHLEEPRMSLVAKKLGIPYAPCLVGFEGPLRAPSIRGIVVHQHNAGLLREAYVECESHYLEKEFQKRQQLIYLRWKRLIVGIQTKARLEKEYGGTSISCLKN